MRRLITVLALGACVPAASAKPAVHPQVEAQVLELSKQVIAMRSVRGPDNKTIDVARAFKAALVAGGWADADIEITPVDDTAYFIATWTGSDPKLGPLVISGHMDVVEAKPADWQRDPFTPVIENGFLFGRGATDMKVDDALVIASLIELRRARYQPRWTIIVAFSGDEETTMKTSQLIATRLAHAELVLNADLDGNGVLDEATGQPRYYSWQGAEKTYADFELEVTSPGGHSSRPTKVNAINQVAAALVRIGQYRFKPELSDLTKAYFSSASQIETNPGLAAAMRAFAVNPADQQAIEVLAADTETVGKIGTTCVVTMINGGHALNALPQRVSANINCRIFPGRAPAAIMAELERVAAEPAVRFRDVTEGAIASPSSPLRGDLVAAVEKAVHSIYPGLPVVPSMSTGASDNMWFRAKGIPSYIISPLFVKSSDYLSHGLNERVPLSNIRPGITYYLSLFTDLAK
jgi:carboxypeptidase PM20D1